MLKVITKGNTSPKNKPKVYFCCHPEDISLLDSICTDIFKSHSCAIYYTDDMTEDIPDRDTVLGSVSLLVVPVTHKLLTESSRAKDGDIPYALEHHIPVLPIMTESELLDIYSRDNCFGELQYLDPHSRDMTEISYEEKLKKYLESVLISETVINRIKMAFRVHIFLSYRKKDRRYANELMRMIHSSPELYDIAIWYDEFLTPGESFKDNIEKILADSKLFALLVTPNLLENGNYVMDVEYPLAKKLGMPILPAEMEITDRAELDRSFEGIPECLACDGDALKKRIMELIADLGEPSSEDADHSFLMGLAYLEGIDVELDRDRAFQIITEVAQKGHIEAVSKLADMYRHGIATERDLAVAADWLKNKVQLLRKQYGGKYTEETRDELFWANIECGDCCKEYGNLNGAVTSYNQAKKIIPEAPRGKDLRNLSVVFNRLGDLYIEMGDKMAPNCYKKAYDIRKQCCTTDPEDMRDMALSCYKLGMTFSAYGDKKTAMSHFSEGLGLIKKIDRNSDICVDADLILFYVHIGDLLESDGRYPEAKQYYDLSLNLSKSLAEETDEEAYWIDLAASYVKIGQICIRNGQRLNAREYFEKASKISSDWALATGSFKSCLCAAASNIELGNISCDMRAYTEAKEYYENALNFSNDNDLWHVFLRIGKVFYLEGDKKTAEQWLVKGIEASADFKIHELDGDRLNCLMFGYNQLGDLYNSEEDLEKAEIYYKKALQTAEELVRRTENVDTLRAVSVGYVNVGKVLAEKDIAKARDYYTKAMNIREKIANTCATPTTLDDLAMVYYRMATVSERKEAEEFLKKVFILYEGLHKRCPSESLYRERYEYFKSLLKQGE